MCIKFTRLSSLYILILGIFIGLIAARFFQNEDAALEAVSHEPELQLSKLGSRVSLLSSTGIENYDKHEERALAQKEPPAAEALIAETNTDSDNFQIIDEYIRSGAFISYTREFEAFCSSSRRENVVVYLLSCVDGGDEEVVLRMNAAALRNPSESIRDQALISMISLTGIDFADHEAAVKWAASNASRR